VHAFSIADHAEQLEGGREEVQTIVPVNFIHDLTQHTESWQNIIMEGPRAASQDVTGLNKLKKKSVAVQEQAYLTARGVKVDESKGLQKFTLIDAIKSTVSSILGMKPRSVFGIRTCTSPLLPIPCVICVGKGARGG
jgi:hypothetical protein